MTYEAYKIREVVQHPDTNVPVFVRETRKNPVLVRHPDTGEVVEAMPVDYETAEKEALEHLVKETQGEYNSALQQSTDEIEHAEKMKADAIRKADELIAAARDRVSEVESRLKGHKSELGAVLELVGDDSDWLGDGDESEAQNADGGGLEAEAAREAAPTAEEAQTV